MNLKLLVHTAIAVCVMVAGISTADSQGREDWYDAQKSRELCWNATNKQKTNWDDGLSSLVIRSQQQLKRRGITLDECLQLISGTSTSSSGNLGANSRKSVSIEMLSKRQLCTVSVKIGSNGLAAWDELLPRYVQAARQRGLSPQLCADMLNVKVAQGAVPKRIEPRRNLSDEQKKRLEILRKQHKNAVAVIVGNRDYAEGLPKVDYAVRDADAFKAFLTGALGYDSENIIDFRDATKAQMETAFGNERTHEGKLWRYLDPQGKSDIMVFYSGHGVPGLKDRRGYLLPVNADANSPEINGYPIDLLLENLAKLEARSIAVFLDACFSGNSAKGMLINATSGITISAKMPERTRGNLVVLSAAKGGQVASWDTEAKHGLFTRYLMEALYGKADGEDYGDGDGKVTLAEVKSYLDDRMTRRARRLWGRHQNADMRGDGGTVLAAGVAEN